MWIFSKSKLKRMILLIFKNYINHQSHSLRIHWRLPTILKTSKKMYEVMFLICTSMIFWNCIQHTIHWEKKFHSDKINDTKKFSFSSREFQLITVSLLIYYSYMSWSTSFISMKLYVGFSIFDSVSFLNLIVLLNKIHGHFESKTS